MKRILIITFIFLIGLVNASLAATNVYYSVGQNTNDHSSGGNVSITSGVATFTVAQTAPNLGVGDRLTAGGNAYYLKSKISTTQWNVVTKLGAVPSDLGSTAVTSIAHEFNSLSAALPSGAGGAKDANHINNTSLVSADVILNIPCYYDTGADTTTVTISGWTTDATRYIKIYTPYNTSTECNQSQRHNGKWDDAKYRLEISTATYFIVISNPNVLIEGIQGKRTAAVTNNGQGGFLIYNAGSGCDIRISNNILVGNTSASSYGNVAIEIYDDANSYQSGTAKAWNNIIYDFKNSSGGPVAMSVYDAQGNFTLYAYNNTVQNCNYGYTRSSGGGTFVAKNNIAQDCTDGFNGTFDASSNYNLSDIASDAPGANSRNSTTVTFVDKANKDFHLASTDTGALNYGTDLSADANLALSDDIDAQTRSGAWDIGADEYKLQVGWYSFGAGSWGYRKQIVIDRTKVSGSGTLPNFPLLISSTDADLKTTGNGGKVTNSSGYDIIFTSSDGTTKLDHEIERYTASSGEFIGWVRVPVVATANDTTIYIYFGNSSISTSQENATGVWDSNYLGVWHLKDGTTLNVNDSSSNGNNGSNNSVTATTGKLDGGGNFAGSPQVITITDTAALRAYPLTESAWIKYVGGAGIISKYPSGSMNGYQIYVSGGTVYGWYFKDSSNYVWDGGSGVSGGNVNDGAWHYVVWTVGSGGGTMYVDGNSINSRTWTGTPGATTQTTNLSIGLYPTTYYYIGTIDEARVSNTARSADWIKTEYNNQSSPSTFYGLGTTVAKPGWRTGDGGTWGYRKLLTIDHTKVSGTGTLPNFPLLISSTDADLKTTANGGKITNSSGYDIIFTDSDGTTKLNHEIERYTASSGEFITWVKIPVVYKTTDTFIYMYFGNSSISTSQENINGVWDSNYKGVWHLKEASGNFSDSTSNANTGTDYVSATGKTGQINSGQAFNNGTSDYINVAGLAWTPTTFTVEWWLYALSTTDYNQQILAVNSWGAFMFHTTANAEVYVGTDVTNRFTPTQLPAGTVPISAWAHFVFTYDGTQGRFYKNGAQLSTAKTMNTPSAWGGFNFGGNHTSTINGNADEVRVSNIARSADWIATEYNNQNSPATFYGLGDTAAQPGWRTADAGTWGYRKLITIDHTKVSGTSTLLNFPLLISSTDADLKTTGNGGKVTNSSGYDIIFTSSDGTTKLDHEIERYTASSGEFIAWVRVPSISPTTDTTLYMYYANSSISTSQENKTGVWDSNSAGVWHVHNASSPATDSTSNGKNGTQSGGVTFGATGKINGATSYDGVNDYLDAGNVGNVNSVSYWIKSNNQANGGIELNSNQYIDDNAIPEGWTNPTTYIDGVAQSSLYGSELVTNGNFGSDISSWNTTNACGSTVSWVNGTSGDGSTGYHRFNLANNTCADRYRASGSITSGSTTYRISFWYRTSSITTTMTFYTSDNFDTLANTVAQSVPLSTSWTYYSFTFTTSSASYPIIGFYHYTPSGGPAGTFDIDAISVKQVLTRYPITDTNWHDVAITTGTAISASAVKIGKGGTNYLNGLLDEVRVSNIARSADWIKTEYNNQNSPSTFYGLSGGEQSSAAQPSTSSFFLLFE